MFDKLCVLLLLLGVISAGPTWQSSSALMSRSSARYALNQLKGVFAPLVSVDFSEIKPGGAAHVRYRVYFTTDPPNPRCRAIVNWILHEWWWAKIEDPVWSGCYP
ncbi:hypothetical protein MAR_035128 [Mya arenaria]|uniref:Uncharacterized protein n=1 Tax=Mya arenaria TaxID=6604 RepID=A0ABY7EM21_MYAAR|nr:uncharacterized protein LOC128241503 [Mya arenaria]WAR10052.1 hypothetical protein MAR_035128 [Mya arenaria]